MLTINKALLDPSALTEIVHAEDVLKRYLFSRSIKVSILRGGMYAIPLAFFEEVELNVQQFIEERFGLEAEMGQGGLVGEMVAKYDDLKADAEKRLREHFDASEYPEADTLRASFGVQVRWLGFDVSAALKSVSKSAYKREQERAAREWASAATDMRDAMREAALQLVGHVVEKLGTSDDGKPKTFRDSMIVKLQDFLDTFAARNIVGDADLEALVGQARELLKGKSPDDLRKRPEVRAEVLQRFETIKATLDAQLVDRPRRKLAKEGEEI